MDCILRDGTVDWTGAKMRTHAQRCATEQGREAAVTITEIDRQLFSLYVPSDVMMIGKFNNALINI